MNELCEKCKWKKECQYKNNEESDLRSLIVNQDDSCPLFQSGG